MKKTIILLLIITVLIISSCSRQTAELKQSTWRGVVLLDKNDSANTKLSELPFIFSYSKGKDGKDLIVITNADEKINVTEIYNNGDSIIVKLPVYKDEIHAKIMSADSIAGEYLHVSSRSKYTLPFYAISGKTERFAGANKPPVSDITGTWEVTANETDSSKDMYVAEFRQSGNKLTGTFLTSAGDYRYLEGAVSGNDVMLSCFEGYYTKLFRAKITTEGNLTEGIIIGGPTSKEKWTAVKNENAKLPDPEKLSMLNSSFQDGTETIDFSFPDVNNKTVSLKDEKYKGKPVIVSIGGSWCPNCKDETRLFGELYEKYNPQGLEIIGLNFESNNFEESVQRIERFRTQLNANYVFLYAGETGRKVTETLPFIKVFKGYPTTIYLDRNHKVKKVHTGFSGPGTGKHYEALKKDIVNTIEELLKEKAGS